MAIKFFSAAFDDPHSPPVCQRANQHRAQTCSGTFTCTAGHNLEKNCVVCVHLVMQFLYFISTSRNIDIDHLDQVKLNC